MFLFTWANSNRVKIKLNIYPAVVNLEQKLEEVLRQAKKKRARLVEVAYGFASESTKKRVLNFLMKKEYRKLYNRMEKSRDGWGRIYLHFRWKDKATRK